jgi:hypothetical protein
LTGLTLPIVEQLRVVLDQLIHDSMPARSGGEIVDVDLPTPDK